jgi:hypothetical protein
MTDSTENTTPQIPEDDHIILDGPVTPAVQESTTDEKKIAYIDNTVVHSAQQDEVIFYSDDWNDNDPYLSLPSYSAEQVQAALGKFPNEKLQGNEKAEWLTTLKEGMELTTFAKALISTLQNENALFKQRVESNGKNLRPSSARLNAKGGSISGERATIVVMNTLGLGSLVQIPLWHTGMWITFKAPSEGDFLELYRQINSDKINLGRSSYGLLYGNTTSYTVDRIIDFALDHVYNTTVIGLDNDKIKIKSLISSHDIPTIILGLLCSLYPNGFQYKRACLNDPEKCNHVVKEKINLFKLLWTNTNDLSAWQVAHMSARQNSVKDLDSLKKYKEELLKAQTKTISIKVKEDIIFELQIPNIEDYVQAGHRWIGDIVSYVNSAIGMTADDKQRNEYITQRAQASSMCQYSHWVSKIELVVDATTDERAVIDDRETIEKTLASLSSSDYVRETFVEEVGKYINETAITVVGIPTYDCPACGLVQESKNAFPKNVNIIPLDMAQTFFGLLVQMISRIKIR